MSNAGPGGQAATVFPDSETGLKGLSLRYPWFFVQLGLNLCNWDEMSPAAMVFGLLNNLVSLNTLVLRNTLFSLNTLVLS